MPAVPTSFNDSFSVANVRAEMAELYDSPTAEAAGFRAAHLNAVTRLTPFALLTNICCGSVILWGFRYELTYGLLAWATGFYALCALGGWRWGRNRRRIITSASRTALRNATVHAALLSGAWAVLVIVWFPGATASQQIMMTALACGMLSGGTFMLSMLPKAAIAYDLIFTVASFAALWRGRAELAISVGTMLLLYGPIVLLGAMFNWHKATVQLRQERTLAVLLDDFEEHAGDALWETDQQGMLSHRSARLSDVLSLREHDAPTQAFLDWMCATYPQGEGAETVQRAVAKGASFSAVQLSQPEATGGRHVTLSGKQVFDSLHRFLGWRGVLSDCTETVQAQRRLWRLAHNDSLTGVANRFSLRNCLLDNVQPGRFGALLTIDLDHFKAVNDNFGHGVGDDLLQIIAKRLTSCARSDDLVARLGGDEFAVVTKRIDASHAVDALARRIVAVVREPVSIQGRIVYVGASIGVVLWEGDTVPVEDLMVQSDIALYHAKDAGRDRYAVYSEAMGEESRRKRQIEDGLRNAQSAGQLSLHWQPQVRLAGRAVVGAEALLRWEHSVLGRVPPVEFIGIAERLGVIHELGLWALREAIQTAVGPLAGLEVSVNVSPLQLRDAHFAQHVASMLQEFGLAPQRLELEITESVFMDNAFAALEQLHVLRALGVRVALDDFGTGYSSLAYLRKFPFDTLKIDRTFVSEMPHQPDTAAIVEMMIRLADTFGMRTVCEGIETQQQWDAAAGSGSKLAQGYLAAPPMPLAQFQAWRQSWVTSACASASGGQTLA